MSTQREEVLIEMAISNEQIAQGLGKTESEIKAWSRRVQSEIAAGSIPENFKNDFGRTFNDAAKNAGKTAGDSFGVSFRDALHGLKGFFGLSIISAIGGGLLKFWDWYTKQLADLVNANGPIQDLRGGILETIRLQLRQRVAERDAEAAARKKKSEDMAADAKAELDLMEQVSDAKNATRYEEMDNEKRANAARLADLRTTMNLRASEVEEAKFWGDRAKIGEATLKYEAARLQYLQLEHAIQKQMDAEANARNGPRRAAMNQLLGTGQFDPILNRLSALRADAAIAAGAGNRDRLRSDIIEYMALQNSLKEKLLQTIDPKRNPNQSVIDSILNMLAPIITKDGVAVRVPEG